MNCLTHYNFKLDVSTTGGIFKALVRKIKKARKKHSKCITSF